MDLREARALHDEVPVMDLHADTPKLMDRLGFDIAARHKRALPGPLNVAGHIDLPRAREGGLGAQIFGLWTFPYPNRGCAASIDRQIDAVERAIAANPDQIALAGMPDDIRAARRAGQLAAMLGIEGGHALEGELGNVERFARRRVRYIGLMHFSRNRLGSPAYGLGANAGQGLTGFGRDVVREMNRRGVVVDLAQINR